MDYSQYDVEDFVADPFFSRWVKRPDDETKYFWENWMAEHPEKSDTVAEAKKILLLLKFPVSEATLQEQQASKAHVMQRINAQPMPEEGSAQPWRQYLSMAAAVSLLLLGAYLVWPRSNAEPYQQYATQFGEQREILLPDSSRIKLNANSSLRFKKDWSDSVAREVWLEGEAFFEILKKPLAADGRFIVHTTQLNVEVLGTTFNVQTRHGETQVVLNTGKVKLQAADQEKGKEIVFLEPGEMGTMRDDRLVKTQVNPVVYSSWKDNRLFFENESIRKIARRLEDSYGYQVIVDKPEWLDYTFTGSCPADDISILLTALAESFDLSVTQSNRQIRIQEGDISQ